MDNSTDRSRLKRTAKLVREKLEAKKARGSPAPAAPAALTLKSLLSVGGPVTALLGKMTDWNRNAPLNEVRDPKMIYYFERHEGAGGSCYMTISQGIDPDSFLVSFSGDKPVMVRCTMSKTDFTGCKRLDTLERFLNQMMQSLREDEDDMISVRAIFSERRTNAESIEWSLGEVPKYGIRAPEDLKERFNDLARERFGPMLYRATKNGNDSLAGSLLWSRQHLYVFRNNFSDLNIPETYDHDDLNAFLRLSLEYYDSLVKGDIRLLN
jgi:hypothetical protein